MMFTSIVQLLISLVLIMLLLSIVASGINEVIMFIFQTRGFFLKNALKEVLDDSKLNKNYTELLYDHPLIDQLKKTQHSLPFYITSESFSAGLIDVIGNESEKLNVLFKQDPVTLTITVDDIPKEPDLLKRFSAGTDLMAYSDLKIFFRTLIERSGSYTELKSNLEKWYNDYMDRVSGWYKNRMQWCLFLIGLVMAIVINVDSIKLTRELYHNQTLRSQLETAATTFVQSHQGVRMSKDSLTGIVKTIDQAYSDLKLYDLPIGWSYPATYQEALNICYEKNGLGNTIWIVFLGLLSKLIGWLITAGILSFGAPFWFDLLGKLVDLRKAGKKPVTETISNTAGS